MKKRYIIITCFIGLWSALSILAFNLIYSILIFGSLNFTLIFLFYIMSEEDIEANKKDIENGIREIMIWIKTTLFTALFYTIIALIVSIFP